MGFFDSQLFGVIVGAAIGGIAKLCSDIRSANRLCKNLERGIKAEVTVIKDSIMSGHDLLSGYLDAIIVGEPSTRKFKSLPEFGLSFTDANLEKIGMLDKEFLEPLIKVKATLEILPEAVKGMWYTHDQYVEGDKGKRNLLVDQLKIAVATFRYIGESCDRLLDYNGNYSIPDKIIRYVRNTKEKIFKKST